MIATCIGPPARMSSDLFIVHSILLALSEILLKILFQVMNATSMGLPEVCNARHELRNTFLLLSYLQCDSTIGKDVHPVVDVGVVVARGVAGAVHRLRRQKLTSLELASSASKSRPRQPTLQPRPFRSTLQSSHPPTALVLDTNGEGDHSICHRKAFSYVGRAG